MRKARATLVTVVARRAPLLLIGCEPKPQPDQDSTADGIEPPDLVIADIARVDAVDVADTYLEVPLLGFTNHTDTAGLRRAHAAGFDQVVAKSALFERPRELIHRLVASVE